MSQGTKGPLHGHARGFTCDSLYTLKLERSVNCLTPTVDTAHDLATSRAGKTKGPNANKSNLKPVNRLFNGFPTGRVQGHGCNWTMRQTPCPERLSAAAPDSPACGHAHVKEGISGTTCRCKTSSRTAELDHP